MVLQGPESLEPDGSTDDSYPYQNDARKRIDSSSLPQPLPIFGTLLGFTDGFNRAKTAVAIQYTEKTVGRRLNRDETQAIAYHMYGLEQTKSYCAAAGATAGMWRWYTTWSAMRFPFWQPSLEKLDPNKFAFIRGPLAQTARQTWRASLYFIVGGHTASMLGQIVFQRSTMMAVAQDSKLRQVSAELKAAVGADGNKMAQRAIEMAERPRPFEEADEIRAKMTRRLEHTSTAEDSGPTASSDPFDSTASYTESRDSLSKEHPQQAQSRLSGPSRSRQSPARQSTQPSPAFDDASPTGGFFQDEVNRSQDESRAQVSSGGSTWDQLRRGGGPTPMQKPEQLGVRRERSSPETQRGKAPSGGSYSFGNGSDDLSEERKRAQQEFDARLERERQGRDAENENKRWS